LEGVLFQKRDEVCFISNNGAGFVEELGKRCGLWEKRATVILERRYLDAGQG
jgi:hypothetical protein